MTQTERYEFQSEAREVLDLMIHSVYSNPDIFLRELVSNASDAIDKLRIEALGHDELSPLAGNGRITISVDEEARRVTISDNGIGMSRDELVSYLVTIARSGTKEFVQAMKEATVSGDLIGQFGIGFYASFIVADKVTVESRKAGTPSEESAWIWESDGGGSYTLAPGSRKTCGTDVILHLKKQEDGGTNYLDAWVLRGIVKRYSDFVSYPIYLEKAGKTEDADEPVNSMKALWTRAESDVTDEEYNEFYRHITHDWEEPAERIVYRAEGTNEFHALLYIPARPPMDLFYRDGEQGVQLYIRRVFIMNDCRELIPEYLRFVRGVVDSEDLPLNVSREILQQDRQVSTIRGGITRKVLETLRKAKRERPDAYEKIWKNFGAVLKEGIVSDAKNREQIMKLALFESVSGARVSLEDYVAAMKDGQKSVYYLFGTSREALAASPKLEAFVARGVNVLLLEDPVDEIWVNTVGKFGELSFVSASAEDVDLSELGEAEGNASSERAKEMEECGLLARIKDTLPESVEDVRFSSRLVDSPATFVRKGPALSENMRQFFKSMGQALPQEKRILELNPAHPLIAKIAEATGGKEAGDMDGMCADWTVVLLALAAVSDGERVENPGEFTRTLCRLLGA